MNNKLISLIVIFTVLVVASVFVSLKMSDKSTSKIVNRPPIVEHFACSDYCPGPREKYVVKIYEGVTDEGQCLKLGVEFRSYTGWSTKYICVVK